MTDKYLTFDDVQILPQYSEVDSRDDVSLITQFTENYKIELPFIASCMPDVCEEEMAIAMWKAGGVGVIHRFMNIHDQAHMVKNVVQSIHLTVNQAPDNWTWKLPRVITPVVAAAIGVTDDYLTRAQALLIAGANVLMLDVAHGHHKNVKEAMRKLIILKNDYKFDIIAGTIATPDAANDLTEWGADALRVGVGGGSACETRIRTGIGVPQLQAVDNITHQQRLEFVEGWCRVNETKISIPILSDGGIRYPGDIAKVIVAGASTVMMGNLFAGTDEAPGTELFTGQWPNIKTKRIYKGAASASQKVNYNGAASYIEGATKIIDARGPVRDIIKSLEEGLRSSLSYVGAYNIPEFQSKGKLIQITQAGMVEAHPHMLFQQ